MFFFNDTATTEIYTLSLHDALPILQVVPRLAHREDRERPEVRRLVPRGERALADDVADRVHRPGDVVRSEEHTSELQSRQYLVCRLLLEKKKTIHIILAGTAMSL